MDVDIGKNNIDILKKKQLRYKLNKVNENTAFKTIGMKKKSNHEI